MYDIVKPRAGEVAPATRPMVDLIDCLHTWDGEAVFLIHSLAGVSRSTAAALIAHVLKTGEPRKSALALHKASP